MRLQIKLFVALAGLLLATLFLTQYVEGQSGRPDLELIFKLGSIFLGIYLVLSLLAYTSVLRRLKKLYRVAHELAKGNYPEPLQLSGNDEIARISQMFDLMVKAISDREQKSQKDHNKNLALFRAAQEAMILASSEGLIVQCNPAAAEMFGFDAEEIIGQSLERLIPQDYRDRHREQFSRYVQGAPARMIGKGPTELLALRRDGIEFPIELVLGEYRGDEGHYFIGAIRDISQRKNTEQKQKNEQAFLGQILNGVPDPIMVIDRDLNVVLMNDAANATFPAPKGQGGKKRRCFNVATGLDRPCAESDIPCPMEEVLSKGVPVTIEFSREEKDGSKTHREVIAAPWIDAKGDILGIIELSRDNTQRHQYEQDLKANTERLKHIASHDPLTDLPNRDLFYDRFSQSILKGRRSSEKIALLYMDLDKFKLVNDSLGHDAGDAVLKAAATRIKSAVREGDTVARVGGDEFAVILDGINSSEDAEHVAAKIIRQVAKTIRVRGHELHINTSIGIAVYPTAGDTVETLLQNADSAMYMAKQQESGSYQVFTIELNVRKQALQTMTEGIKAGLDKKEFEVYYQPEVELETGHVVGIEAMLRWRHPRLGLLEAWDIFIAASEAGLSAKLGQWVMLQASSQFAKWDKAGLAPTTLTVNLVPQQLKHADFIPGLNKLVKRYRIQRDRLRLEFKEDIFTQLGEAMDEILPRIEKAGFVVSIDNFGVGSASLHYLSKPGVGVVKIDRSIVRDLEKSEDNRAIVNAVARLGKVLDIEVVGVGVETDEQVRLLVEQGCNFGQGFRYSEPLSTEEMGMYLQAGKRGNLRAGAKAGA